MFLSRARFSVDSAFSAAAPRAAAAEFAHMLWRSFPRFLDRELHAVSNFLKYLFHFPVPSLCSRAGEPGSLTRILEGQLEGDTEQNAELGGLAASPARELNRETTRNAPRPNIVQRFCKTTPSNPHGFVSCCVLVYCELSQVNKTPTSQIFFSCILKRHIQV